MKCPFCNSEQVAVIDSRPVETKNAIRRRRECLNCGKRFTTFEHYIEKQEKITDKFNLYFQDLKPETQKELLNYINVTSATEMGWKHPIKPLAVVNITTKPKKSNRKSKQHRKNL